MNSKDDNLVRRKPITKKQREILFNRTNGQCGYCACELPKRWHVDHIVPIASDAGTHDLSNMIASCPQCNNFKNTFLLEQFRHELSQQVERARSYSVNFRMAEKYGLIQEVGSDVTFYFERLKMEVPF